MENAGLSRQHHVHIIIDSFLDACRKDPDQFFRVDDPGELIPPEGRDTLLANGRATTRRSATSRSSNYVARMTVGPGFFR